MTAIPPPLGRHLEWPACRNVRDLGGYPATGGGFVSFHAIVRSDNLCRLTAEGQAALTAYGVQTIIDLRSPNELALGPHPFAGRGPQPPDYLNLPLIDETDRGLSVAIAAAASTSEAYCLLLTHCRAQIASILRGVAVARPGAVLIHCHAGRDRTGLIAALLLAHVGVSADIVAGDYADTEFDPPSASTMLEVLAWIENQYGGVEAYLAGCWLQSGELAALRDRLHRPGESRSAVQGQGRG
jgi:protein-tyrosine phosphatase